MIMPSFFPVPSSAELITFALVAIGIGAFLAIAELSPWLLSKPGLSRKFVRTSCGLLLTFTPGFFTGRTLPTLLGVIMIAANVIAKRSGYLQAINATEQKTMGVVYFPLAYTLLVILGWEHPVALSIALFAMASGDAAATLVGARWGHHRIHFAHEEKSWEGSIALALITAGAVLFVIASPNDPLILSIFCAAAIGAVAAAFEILSPHGTDNLSVPFAIATLVIAALTPQGAENVAVGFLGASALALTALMLGWLSQSGVLAMMTTGTIIYAVGTFVWGLPLVLFFLSGSFLSFVDRTKHHSPPRTSVQVFANGGAGLILAALFAFTHHELFFWMFAASIAAVTADTWATEIGMRWGGIPRLITHLSRRVDRGVSGGVTFTGILAAILGAETIYLSTLYQNSFAFTTLSVVVSAGLVGSLVDSYLGSSVQASYVQHDGTYSDFFTEGSLLVRGKRWITNDTVNFFCGLSGAMFVLLLYFLF